MSNINMYKKSRLQALESFAIASTRLREYCEKEGAKENPNLNLLAAYAALGKFICNIGEHVKCRVGLTVSLTVEGNGKGDNISLMLGNEEFIEKGNDILISCIQQEIINQMHEGDNQ